MENVKKPFNSRRPIFIILVFLSFVVVIGVLKIAASIILPLTIAFLLVIIMYPLVKLLEKAHFPRTLSIFLVISLVIAGIYGLGMVFFSFGKMLASQFSFYEERLGIIYASVADLMGLSYDKDLSFINNLWGQLGVRTFVLNFTGSSFNVVFQFISSAIVMVLFIGFILVEASFFREKLELAFSGNSGRINNIAKALMTQVMRYLTAKFLISFANGFVFAVAFYLVGLHYAPIWGVFQFVLNFIPALGSIAAGIIISIFSLLQFWPEPGPVIQVVIIILAGNMITNVVDPKVVGEHVGISPLMVLISLSLWGWIWGFAGMILAVPMTVSIKLVFENISFLKPVSVLMGARIIKPGKIMDKFKKKNKSET